MELIWYPKGHLSACLTEGQGARQVIQLTGLSTMTITPTILTHVISDIRALVCVHSSVCQHRRPDGPDPPTLLSSTGCWHRVERKRGERECVGCVCVIVFVKVRDPGTLKTPQWDHWSGRMWPVFPKAWAKKIFISGQCWQSSRLYLITFYLHLLLNKVRTIRNSCPII